VGRLLGGDTTLGLSVAVAKELGLQAHEVGEATALSDSPVQCQPEELGLSPATL
jgi:hypothetical protein